MLKLVKDEEEQFILSFELNIHVMVSLWHVKIASVVWSRKLKIKSYIMMEIVLIVNVTCCHIKVSRSSHILLRNNF